MVVEYGCLLVLGQTNDKIDAIELAPTHQCSTPNFAKATCGTIGLKLLKIGALVRASVRRITFAMASGYPNQRDFAVAHAQLTNAAAR